MARSYIEEFNRRYNQPQIDNITVGFSGIDPAPKSVFEEASSTGSTIVIDSGEVSVDSGEITAP